MDWIALYLIDYMAFAYPGKCSALVLPLHGNTYILNLDVKKNSGPTRSHSLSPKAMNRELHTAYPKNMILSVRIRKKSVPQVPALIRNPIEDWD